ncbi:hypothetical protein [Roseibium sp.]|uniref:hypothetical protein n=1 Tax=Roseibium sp. TaxID=1936156 RepID=UPI003B5283D3
MAQIELDKATKPQLLTQAGLMNLEVPQGATAKDIRELIREHKGPETFTIAPSIPLMTPVDADEEPEVIADKTFPDDEDQDTEDEEQKITTVTLTIARQEGERANLDLYCNGECMLIPRGKPVTIPIRYFEVLENAKKISYTVGTEPGEPALSNPMETPRFSYVVHSKQ